MESIRLDIDESIFENVLWFINQLPKNKIRIIQNNNEFKRNKQYLHEELNKIDAGKATYITIDEAEEKLDKILSRYDKI